MTPIADRVICRKLLTETIRDSGIVIPQTAGAQDRATVIAVGPGRKVGDERRPMTVKVGDIIIFPETRGQMFVYDEVEYVVLNEEHIIARVVDGEVVPLNDYVVAETVKVSKHGRFVLPDAVAADRDEARVLRVGPGGVADDGSRDDMPVQVGDVILYNRRMGDEMTWGDDKLVAFHAEHVVCIVSRDEKVARAA